jgi:DnaJ-class molecular chaperone
MSAPRRNNQSGVRVLQDAGAEAKYHEAQRAYETLSDKDKRQMYDQVTPGRVRLATFSQSIWFTSRPLQQAPASCLTFYCRTGRQRRPAQAPSMPSEQPQTTSAGRKTLKYLREAT